ncbi:hypothetical protein OOT46_04205 [Aquabacterium sp. A7-Y]|uniref:extracellular catalytic domain type 2 short-chain-length polyhydroxyalkanoate depolymerase n=1 Tax=Aquabacterium sp. A7-Y TaxID=1349605 RepID=UPI00223DFCD4|nr:PHB depolymerase family esterase [Aquabacterium sp. A7-Y]MCW7537053.1 hypothetical protein [Aquabacterium sp. A7-Y]
MTAALSIGASLMGIAGASQAAEPLPTLAIDTSKTTVSGLSSGGYAAVQLHVAYSSTFKTGAGVVAGGPFYCAQGDEVAVSLSCTRIQINPIPVSRLVEITESWAEKGDLDPVENLRSSKVYLFSGSNDRTVITPVMNDLLTYYKNFVPAGNIAYKKDVPAGHAMVTDEFGNDCTASWTPYINNCGFDLAGALLQHLYGPLNPRSDGAPSGRFIEFDQTAFIPAAPAKVRKHGIADTAWIYVPRACSAGATCKLHVVLHGCLQSTMDLGQQYVRDTGYNRWADTNNIVMLYPQTNDAQLYHCWDWWGYTSPDYAKKGGPQMQAIKAMVDHLSGGAAAE